MSNNGGFPISFEENGISYIRGMISVVGKGSRFCSILSKQWDNFGNFIIKFLVIGVDYRPF